MVDPIERPNLLQTIIERVLEMIYSGEINPGDRLPPERILSEKLNVGRSSLREALKTLTFMGILETKQGGGTYVNEDGTSLIGSSIKWGVLLNEQTLLQLIYVRYLVEPQISSLAATKRSENELEKLIDILNKMAKCDDVNLFVDIDVEFHITIAKMSQNAIFVKMIEAMHAMMKMWMIKAMPSSINHATGITEHKPIVDAISKQQSQLAKVAMIKHLDKAYMRVFGTENLPSELGSVIKLHNNSL